MVVMDMMEAHMVAAVAVAAAALVEMLQTIVVVMVVMVVIFHRHLEIQLWNQVQLILPV